MQYSGAQFNADVPRASGCCWKRNGDGILGVFVPLVNSHARAYHACDSEHSDAESKNPVELLIGLITGLKASWTSSAALKFSTSLGIIDRTFGVQR